MNESGKLITEADLKFLKLPEDRLLNVVAMYMRIVENVEGNQDGAFRIRTVQTKK